MPADVGIFTLFLNNLLTAIGASYLQVVQVATFVFGALAVLEITTFFGFKALDNEVRLSMFIRKIFFLSIVYALILYWHVLADAIVEGFIIAGARAAGTDTATATALMRDPSQILDSAWDHYRVLVQEVRGRRPSTWFSYGVPALAVIISFFIITVTVILTFIEFALLSTLAVVLLPFSAWRPTRAIGEKPVALALSYGIRLMVLAFILFLGSTQFGVLVGDTPNDDPTAQQALLTAMFSVLYCVLALKIPSLASGLLTATPSLGIADVGRAAIGGASVAAGTVGATAALGGVAAGAARLGGAASASVGRVAARLGGGVAGAASAAGQAGSVGGAARALGSAAGSAASDGLRQAGSAITGSAPGRAVSSVVAGGRAGFEAGRARALGGSFSDRSLPVPVNSGMHAANVHRNMRQEAQARRMGVGSGGGAAAGQRQRLLASVAAAGFGVSQALSVADSGGGGAQGSIDVSMRGV